MSNKINNLDVQIQIPISNLAKILNVHPRTLRIWDKEGILCPKRMKNRRYYTLEDVEKAKAVQYLLCDLGSNIAGAKLIFAVLKLDRNFAGDMKENIERASEIAGIDKEIQRENRMKNAKRGRRKADKYS